ncbi:MAG: hypothetical protein Q9O62_13950 [Ardenticatenia bacterium]|nr:hypothetical protein [Ardenticatenia bacterium]
MKQWAESCPGFEAGLGYTLVQIDVFAYVQEMRRVVKPGGLVFYDGINLTAEEG